MVGCVWSRCCGADACYDRQTLRRVAVVAVAVALAAAVATRVFERWLLDTLIFLAMLPVQSVLDAVAWLEPGLAVLVGVLIALIGSSRRDKKASTLIVCAAAVAGLIFREAQLGLVIGFGGMTWDQFNRGVPIVSQGLGAAVSSFAAAFGALLTLVLQTWGFSARRLLRAELGDAGWRRFGSAH